MYSGSGMLVLQNQYIGMIISVVVSYFIGNISPAILLGRLHGVDIRNEGSGNAGTTNVLRVLGKKAAFMTLLTDILKGTVAVVLFGLLFGKFAAMISVVAVFLGHLWPIVFGFKGGKGVATAFGAISGLNPVLGFGCLGVVLLAVAVTKRMSVGSIVGCMSFPFLSYFIEPDFMKIGSVVAVIILIKHRENIGRLARGEEPKMSFKK